MTVKIPLIFYNVLNFTATCFCKQTIHIRRPCKNSWCSLQPVYVQDASVYPGPADGIWGAPVGWDAVPALPPAVYVQNTAVYPGPADCIRGVPGGWDAVLVLPPACLCSGCCCIYWSFWRYLGRSCWMRHCIPALPPAVYVHNTAVYPGPAGGIRGVPGGWDAILVFPPTCVCSGCCCIFWSCLQYLGHSCRMRRFPGEPSPGSSATTPTIPPAGRGEHTDPSGHIWFV